MNEMWWKPKGKWVGWGSIDEHSRGQVVRYFWLHIFRRVLELSVTRKGSRPLGPCYHFDLLIFTGAFRLTCSVVAHRGGKRVRAIRGGKLPK